MKIKNQFRRKEQNKMFWKNVFKIEIFNRIDSIMKTEEQV